MPYRPIITSEVYQVARFWRRWKVSTTWSDRRYEEKRFFTRNSAREWRARRALEGKF